jgi:hypothetical protein
MPLGFYEDIPYALIARESQIRRTVTAMERRLRRRLFPIWIRGMGSERLYAMECYPSQIDARSIAVYQTCLERRGGERVWASAPLARVIRHEALP